MPDSVYSSINASDLYEETAKVGRNDSSRNCCELCLFIPLNPVAPPPTQGSPFRSMSPAPQTLNSPLIHTDIDLGLSSRLGCDVSASMTHTSHTTKPVWLPSLFSFALMALTTKIHANAERDRGVVETLKISVATEWLT
uniref:Uncharacterized protein n=1 Tax=Mesocestoides corti TaxID=53468 RepID=A0A5K3FWJ8_MESCO